MKKIKQKSTDAKICEALLSVLKSDFDKDATIFDISVGEIITWLEKKLQSLNSQSTWKPSDKQMKAFENVYDWYRDNSNFIPSMPLLNLYTDLKKLMEE